MIDHETVAAACRRLTKALAPASRRYVPFVVDGDAVGWVTPERTLRLAHFPRIFDVNAAGVAFVRSLAEPQSRSDAVAEVAATLAAEGALSAWRNERYAIVPEFGAPPLFLLERAAARYFGVHTYAAHVNGLVATAAGPRMWLARRSAGKAIDPGMLDNLVGGGIAAGSSIADTVLKESWEEAGIAADVAAQATRAGRAEIRRDQADGLHWETIFTHDLWLPPDFAPKNQDGEAVDHRRVSFSEAMRLIAIEEGPDEVTADASLVALECIVRRRAIAARDVPPQLLDAMRPSM